MPRRPRDTREYVLILWGVSVASNITAFVVRLIFSTQLQFPDHVVWKNIKDLLRSIITGEPKRVEIPLKYPRRVAFVTIHGEEDAWKACSKLFLIFKTFGQI